jgi:hypothetical protein
MLRSLIFFVVFASFVYAVSGQTSPTAGNKEQNLRDCLDGFEACDRSMLTNEQARQISDLQHDQNLWVCFTGNGECDHSGLSPEESKNVATVEQRRNALACETTIGICDQALLTPSQTETVAQIQNEQNKRLWLNRGCGVAHTLKTNVIKTEDAVSRPDP